MSEYDGDIKLSVGLDPASVKQVAQQLKAELGKAANVNIGQKVNVDLKQIEGNVKDIAVNLNLLMTIMIKLSKKAEILFAEMKGLGGVRVPTEEYKRLADELERLEQHKKELSNIKDIDPGTAYGIKRELMDINHEIEQTQEKMKRLEEDGKAFTIGSDAAVYDKFISQLSDLCTQMKMVADSFRDMTSKTADATQTVDNSNQAAKEVQENVNKATQNEKQASDGASEKAKKATSRLNAVKNAAANVAKGIGNIVKTMAKLSVTGIKKLANGFKKVASLVANITRKIASLGKKLFSLGRHTNSHEMSLNRIIKKVLMYGLGIQTVMAAWNKLRSYAKSALTEMAKQFDDVDTSISGIVNSFNQFKNSIGTVVQPLVNLFGPAIERIIQGMTAMSNKIANFMAVFTGQEYIYKATKSNKKYADSLKKTSDAAKEANEKLGEYDNLLVIQQQNQSDKSDSGSAEPMFEKVAVEPSGFAESLKDSISKGDWAGIGREIAMKLNTGIASIDANGIARSIAEKINNATSLIANFLTTFNFAGLGEKIGGALSTFLTTINWENIAVSIGAGMKGKFDFISNFFETMDWEGITTNIINGFKRVNWVQVAQSLIKALKTALSSAIKIINTIGKEIDGRKLGEDVGTIFNDIVTSIGELIEELDWDEVASDIGGFLAGALGAIDWGELLRTGASLLVHIFDALSTILTEINWEELGHNIYEGFCSVDWGELFKSIFHFVGVAIGGLGQLIGTFIMDGIADMWEYFEQAIEDSGGDIVLGILNGIIDALVGIGKWLYDNVFKPIWDGICEVFGIASPSKKMEEIGGFVVDGFLAAFDGLKKAICAIFNAALNVIRIPINMIIGFVNTMIGAVESGINFIIDALNKLHWKAPDWLGGWEFGFNFSHVSFWKIPEIPEAHFGEDIPALAQGAVIPPNREFLALLGDQPVGTNIEAPLDTIVQAFNMALNSRTDTRQAAPIVLQLNGRTVAQAVWDEEEKRYKQTGSYRPNFA